MTGSLDKSFEGTSKTTRVDRYLQIRGKKIVESRVCLEELMKSVLLARKLFTLSKRWRSMALHGACFKCSHGGCFISPSNFAAHGHQIYCRHHHSQIFKAKGNFSQLVKQDQVKEVVKQDQVKEVVKQDQVKEVDKHDQVTDVVKQDQVTDVVKPDQVTEVTENTTT